MASYRDINYSIRPAKNIERKMLVESMRKLSFIDDLENYRYIGFGSTYFSDFELFHKELNFKTMISIESSKNYKRFEFNLPFACVDMKFGHSNHVLPTLFNRKHIMKDIIWLDYDSHYTKLHNNIKVDIDTIVSNVNPGSMFLLSFNVDKPSFILSKQDKLDPKKEKTAKESTLTDLAQKLNIQINIPFEVDPRNIDNSLFSGHNFANFCKYFVDEQIQKSLVNRNTRQPTNKLEYKQFFYFLYQDGAPMLTVGGILFSEEMKETVKLCNMDKLFYIRPRLVNSTQWFGTKEALIRSYSTYIYDHAYLLRPYSNQLKHIVLLKDEPFVIETPNLTIREMKYLKKYVTDSTVQDKDISGEYLHEIIPKKDIEKFHKIYRYFPSFAESNL